MRKLLGLGCMIASLAACSPPATESAAESPGSGPVAKVKVASAERRDLIDTATVYGAAIPGATESQAIASPMESIIDAIDVPVGSRVDVGRPLLRLRPSPLSALELKRAESDAALADAAFARAKRLRADGLASDADVEAARSAQANARMTLESLQRRVKALTLKSPVAGVVQLIGGNVGDTLVAGATAVRLAVSGRTRARFGIQPMLARLLKPGAEIDIFPQSASGGISTLVQDIDPVADPQTRLAALYASIPVGEPIASGEVLRAVVKADVHRNVVAIPYSALLEDGGETFVFVVEHGVARRQSVTTGTETTDFIEVRSGLEAQAQVVIDGGAALEDGMTVTIAE